MKAPNKAPKRAPDMINSIVVIVIVVAPTFSGTVQVPQKREKSTPYRYRRPLKPKLMTDSWEGGWAEQCGYRRFRRDIWGGVVLSGRTAPSSGHFSTPGTTRLNITA
jgi:hypothetical protein